MKRPAVLLVDPGCFTPGYDHNLARSLCEAGWDVELITSEHDFEHLGPFPGVTTRLMFPSWPRRGHRRGSRLARRLGRLAGYPIGLLRLASELRRRPPGILHVQWSHLPWLDLVFWRRWRRAGWRVVYTAHDVLPLAGTTPRAFAGGYERLAACADAVVVHYPAARSDLVDKGIQAPRVHVIPPASPVASDSAPGRVQARRTLGFGPEVPVVLFFGFVKPYKGLEVLLESLPMVRAAVPGARLVVAGEFVGSQARYERLARRLGLESAITWRPGYVASSDVAGLFAAADVVALPYIAASSSGVLLTAYSCRRPVVASSVGGLADLVEDGATGVLVPPGDPRALAAAIGTLLADPARAEQMGNCGYALKQRRHNWKGVAESLDSLYRGLAE